MRIRRTKLKGDFVQLPNGTVRDERLSHMARGILAELLSRPDGWDATADDMWRASVAVHGKDSPGRRQFRAAFAELKAHGYLTSGRELIAGGRHATILTLTDVPHGGTSVRPGVSSNTAGGTDVPHAGTPEQPTGVPPTGTPERPGQTDLFAGRTDVPLSDVPHAGTSKEENGEPNTEKNTSSPARRLAPVPPVDYHLDAFGAFWIVYPKKKDREDAKRAWIAAIERGAEPKRMVDAATAYARDRAQEDPKYTKYPATWLNKGCYDDEPDEPRLRAVAGGYQPYQNPTNQDDYDQPFWSD